MVLQRLDRPAFHGPVSTAGTGLYGILRTFLLFITPLVLLLLQGSLLFAGSGDSNSGYNSKELLSPFELHSRLKGDDSILVLDVRPRLFYLAGHIPAAHNIWRPAYQADESEFPYQGMRASRQKLENKLSLLGITDKTLIVLYDDHDGKDAARLWWLLKLYGHDSLAILNGGLKSWKARGYTTSIIPPRNRKKTTYRFSGREHPTYLADLGDVIKASETRQAILLDVRSLPEHSGKVRLSGAHRKGHIPGSIWFDYRQTVDDQGFLQPEKLKALLAGANISPDREIIVYCQSGVRSAHTLFVLTQLLNFPRVSNYDGSWIEWSWHKRLPVERTTQTKAIKAEQF